MPQQPTRSLGFIEQDPSDKDLIFGGVPSMPGAAADVDLRQWCSPVEDQGPINSCVGNATCSALEMLRIKQGTRHLDFSRLFTYFNARALRGDAGRDIGSVIRLAFQSLNQTGTCTEAVWPYVTSRVLTRPPLLAYRNAYAARIKKYELIPGRGQERVEAIANALRGGYPVVFGINVTESFMYPGTTDTPKITGPYIGAHAMTVVGYRHAQKQFIIRNSWGTGWCRALRGYCYMPVQYFDDHRATDLWVPQETPKL